VSWANSARSPLTSDASIVPLENEELKNMALQTATATRVDLRPPEPDLTVEEMIGRAIALRPVLRARQGECETLGRVPDDINEQLIAAGFYRIVQPRRFGGYEFDVPSFYRVMMEVARGCAETGWVLSLTAGHPLLISGFPDRGQAEIYGERGEFRCPAAFNPPGKAVRVEGGYRVTGAWASASGCDLSTHFMGMAQVAAPSPADKSKSIQMVFPKDQIKILDDWHVIGMAGTGSKTVTVTDAFVPDHLVQETVGYFRGTEALDRAQRMYQNPMYSGRIEPFLIGEASAVVVGAARGALDVYEELMLTKKTITPPVVERFKDVVYQQHYGKALSLISTAEAALIRAGEEYMAYSREHVAGSHAFDEPRAQRLALIEQQCVSLAWDALDLIFRTAGTTASAKQGQPIGRYYRNIAVVRTHPALQMDNYAVAAARQRFSL
jgi:3-hydroxy-9,10-secoandrosta-1,3,5(10)-triene-9,17-dione monooxygenase